MKADFEQRRKSRIAGERGQPPAAAAGRKSGEGKNKAQAAANKQNIDQKIES